ncbi:MAG: protein translocase subunit SecDF [Rhizobiaceae bacterium]|nr:protein translocase subunit SecDF [Rhizobiaceae bacterium]
MLYFPRWQSILIWLLVLVGLAFAVPNLLPQSVRDATPDWLPNQPMTLGLDLRGGSHILLEVDGDGLLADRVEVVRDDVRRLLREEQIGYTGLSGSGRAVQVRIRDAAQIEAAREVLSPLTDPVATGLFGTGAVTELDFSEPEPGLFRFTFTDEGINYHLLSATSQSVEVIGRRVNELGTTEPIVQRQGDDRILVQVPGLDDPERLKDLLGQTAKLTFQMLDETMPVEEAIANRPPVGATVMYSTDDPPIPYLVQTEVLVSGENLTNAQATTDQRTGEWVVSFRFDQRGGQAFGQATTKNVGKRFAIILDDQVISAPVIREPITGGSGQISGDFNAQSANDLAVLLRAGALPADLKIVEERTVGPSLGADSIAAGQIASIISALGVVAFMVLAYGSLGIIANIALVANVAMIIGILSGLGATLTLPGIAGIVLTIGMAVDSNVIIFERVREERAQGRSLVQSLDAGFRNAMSTIIDANVTTLIAAVIMFYLGSGPIRGFAVTLAIGIVTTVFTAFLLTRWMIAIWLRQRRPTELPRGLVKMIPDDTKIRFMRLRNFAFTASAALSVLAAVLFFTVQMNMGIDFRGGSLLEVQAKQEQADISDVRTRLEALNLGEVQVQEFGSPRELLIRVSAQEGGDAAEQSAMQLVRNELAADYEFRRQEVVGPTISAELARAGTIAVIAALFAMLVYIWLRFEWQFAIGAIVATLHDVVMVIGFYVITGLEFNLSSIAAVLTVVGYSINDTVVVYDRIRENLRKYKKMPLADLIDLTVNQTLSRTILTGATTLVALIALWAFGGEVIASFTIAMIFGIVIGTYSSIFIAGPLLILFKLRPETFGEGIEHKPGTPAQATKA